MISPIPQKAENPVTPKIVDQKDVAHQPSCNTADYPNNQECPSDAYAKVVFSLDDKWMEESNDEEGAEPDEQAEKVVCMKKFNHGVIKYGLIYIL